MKTEERANEQKHVAKAWPVMSCCGPNTASWGMPDCFAGFSGTADSSSMMRRCMAMCRWFPLVPVILGTSLFLLGYYLDASISRILWMSAAGFVAVMGVFGLILAGRMKKICRGMGRRNQLS